MGSKLPELFLFPVRNCRCQEKHGAHTADAAGPGPAAAAGVTAAWLPRLGRCRCAGRGEELVFLVLLGNFLANEGV